MTFALALSVVLAGLAGAWRLPWLSHTDVQVSLWVQQGRGPRADALMSVLTWLGSGVVLCLVALLAAGWLARIGRKREGLAAVLSLLSLVLNVGLKLVAARPRPGNPVAVITETYGTSFPSGHSMGSAAVYGTLAAIVWSVWGRWEPVAGLALVPVLVGVSRVFFGAHWGFDVVAGWAAGALCVAGVVAWLRRGAARTTEA